MTKLERVLGVAAAVLLAGCTATGDVSPTPAGDAPVPPASVSTTPTPSVTASLEPTVDPGPLPSPSGWSPRPQIIGEGTQPDTPWATERDVDEVLAIWASYSCVEASQLPRPVRVLEGSYTDVDGVPAVVESLEFEEGSDAGREFIAAYTDASVACGTATRIGELGLRREIQGAVWSEVLLTDGRGVTLAVIEADLGEEDLQALASQLD